MSTHPALVAYATHRMRPVRQKSGEPTTPALTTDEYAYLLAVREVFAPLLRPYPKEPIAPTAKRRRKKDARARMKEAKNQHR